MELALGLVGRRHGEQAGHLVDGLDRRGKQLAQARECLLIQRRVGCRIVCRF